MTRRKGLTNSEVIFAQPASCRRRRSRTLWAVMTCSFVVFCFSKSEDAVAFGERFGGKRLSARAAGGDPENQAGDPSTLFRTNARCRASGHGGGPDQRRATMQSPI
jgi:hypothetical protein